MVGIRLQSPRSTQTLLSLCTSTWHLFSVFLRILDGDDVTRKSSIQIFSPSIHPVRLVEELVVLVWAFHFINVSGNKSKPNLLSFCFRKQKQLEDLPVLPPSLPATQQLLDYLYAQLSPGQKKLRKQSMFSLRTEEASAAQYFQFYGYLSRQQNMIQVTHVVSLVLRPPPEGLGMRLVTTRDLSELKLLERLSGGISR